MSALTPKQIAALPGMVARLGGHDGFAAWDASDSLRDMAPSLAATVIEQQAEIERLREALGWYANPAIYAPHPHGPAFDRRDVSYVARAALEVKP